jgi:hypothetical protein
VLAIKEGSYVLFCTATTEDVPFKPKKSTVDLADSRAKYATPEKMNRLLDKLREEYA